MRHSFQPVLVVWRLKVVRRVLWTVALVTLATACAGCSSATRPIGTTRPLSSVHPTDVANSARSSPASHDPVTHAVRTPCAGSSVRLRALAPRSFDGDEIRQVVTIRNRSDHRCEVVGYPATRFTSHGRPLAYRRVDGGDSTTGMAPVRAVALAPGAVGSFAMDLGQSLSNNGAYCHGVTKLQIRLPGSVRWQATPDSIRVCGNGGTVTAVVNGDDGPQHELASADRPRRCGASDLRGRWGAVAGTAGSEMATLTLTNIDDLPCVLDGYVRLRRLGADHQPIVTQVHRGGSDNGVFPDPGPRRIVLAVDHSAVAQLSWGDNPVQRAGHPADACRSSFYLVVSPPGQGATLTIKTGDRHGPARSNRVDACGGDLTVTAMQPGPRPAKH
jgi:hypothetical protein